MNRADIQLAVQRYADEGRSMFTSSSFQTHSMVLLHILSESPHKIPVYFINTGYHFPETIAYKELMTRKLGLTVIDVQSIMPKSMQKDPKGRLLFTSDPDHCCHLNKTQPIESVLQSYDVWINGVRGDQNRFRSKLKVEESTPFHTVRFHPMLDWTVREIFAYIKEYDIPRHPLDAQGYLSIGCEPCTSKRHPEINEREARWYGLNKTECGLHTDLIRKKMRVLITGGAGYIGTGLVEKLVTVPGIEKIIIYDNLSRGNYSIFLGHPGPHSHKLEFVEGDILDSRQIRKILPSIDTVIHLAAKVITPFANTDSHFFEQVNHWGTAELVYALEESDVRRLIYLSTTSVYGRSKELATEEKIPNPRTFYGISKYRGELHVMRLFDKMQTYILRCGNAYGYNKSVRFDSVINRFIFDANYKNRITINGNGTQARAFIHVDTITQVLTNLISADVPPGIYNTVTHNKKILDLVDILKGIYPQLEFIFINQHLNLRGIRVQPNERFMEVLQVAPSEDMEAELRQFLEQLPFGTLAGKV